MKQSNILKTLSLLITVIAMSLAFASCSSDKDEPENSGNSEFLSIPYSDLTGTWLIENIKDSETGKVVPIDQTINIGTFSPLQTSGIISEISNGYTWAESYEDLISYKVEEEIQYCTPVLSFVNESKSNLSSSRIWSLSFGLGISGDNGLIIKSFVISNLRLSDGKLYSGSGAYLCMQNGENISFHGSITMRKL